MEPQDNAKIILSEAMAIAKEEGVDGNESTEALITRANEIANDAALDEPVTEAGKRAKKAVAIESPYVKKDFDYQALRDSTSNVAVKEMFKEVAKYENLVIPMKSTDEQKKVIESEYQALTLEVFKILNDKKVGIGEYKYIFAAMKAVINSMEGIIMQQVDGHTTEIHSRLLGTKNPGTNKYDKGHATYEDLLNLLDKARKDTGDNREDYFTIDMDMPE